MQRWYLGLWKCCGNRLLHSGEAIGADNQYVLYSPVLQFVQYRQPVLRDFIVANADRQYLLPAFGIDTKDDIHKLQVS